MYFSLVIIVLNYMVTFKSVIYYLLESLLIKSIYVLRILIHYAANFKFIRGILKDKNFSYLYKSGVYCPNLHLINSFISILSIDKNINILNIKVHNDQ